MTNMLREKSIEDLRNYCLKVEGYAKEKGDRIMGGIHDYVTKMDKDACMKYILKVSFKHRELLDLDTFRTTVEPSEMLFLAEEPTVNDPEVGDGGLNDFIFRLKRERLLAFANTLEKYISEKTSQPIDPAFDGKLKDMKNNEIAEYILDRVVPYPELNDFKAMNDLAIKYGYEEEEFLVFFNPTDGGLHDYIWRESRDTLIKWALTAEKHHKFTKGIKVIGGLGDYVNSLTNQQLVEYILGKASQYKELNSAVELDRLATTYGIHI